MGQTLIVILLFSKLLKSELLNESFISIQFGLTKRKLWYHLVMHHIAARQWLTKHVPGLMQGYSLVNAFLWQTMLYDVLGMQWKENIQFIPDVLIQYIGSGTSKFNGYSCFTFGMSHAQILTPQTVQAGVLCAFFNSSMQMWGELGYIMVTWPLERFENLFSPCGWDRICLAEGLIQHIGLVPCVRQFLKSFHNRFHPHPYPSLYSLTSCHLTCDQRYWKYC